MKPTFIKYGKRKIRIQYVILKDCFGLYDPNTQILEIDRRLKGFVLFNTIFHELFHIINDGFKDLFDENEWKKFNESNFS